MREEVRLAGSADKAHEGNRGAGKQIDISLQDCDSSDQQESGSDGNTPSKIKFNYNLDGAPKSKLADSDDPVTDAKNNLQGSKNKFSYIQQMNRVRNF